MAIKTLRPDVRVIAAEPEWANDTYRSWKSGQIESPERYDTIGDGLRTMVGSLTFPIINELIDDILTTSEEAIAAATRTLFHKGRLVCEPSGAVPLAVMTEHAKHFVGRNVVGIISGGNLDVESFSLTPLTTQKIARRIKPLPHNSAISRG